MWLVYGYYEQGRVITHKCTRTRRLVDASSDLAYLKGLEKGESLGIIFGDVFRRASGATGEGELYPLSESLQVVAEGSKGRFEFPTDSWGAFQLVLPPGDYEIWAESAERRVSAAQRVHVDEASEQRAVIIIGSD
ncbi:MAG: hypothetical protein Kow00109_14560 [Acidobacteriota bacterium]